MFGLIAADRGVLQGNERQRGRKANESVVITFLLLFVANFVLSTIYLQIIPPKRPHGPGTKSL